MRSLDFSSWQAFVTTLLGMGGAALRRDDGVGDADEGRPSSAGR